MAAVHLGREGEESIQHLLDGYQLRTFFSVSVVLSPYSDALAEVRRRLGSTAPQLYRVQVDEGVRDNLRKIIDASAQHAPAPLEESETRSLGQRPVIWLEQPEGGEKHWKACLAYLNIQRDWIARHFPGLLVLAGPLELTHWAGTHAPDLWSITGRVHFLKESPKDVPPAQALRWLHLSDLHFRDDERWDRRVLLTKLLDHTDKLRDEGLTPQLVLVTGDIANTGAQVEYEQAQRFFDKLAERTQLDPRQRFFLVPGNHDVDRKAVGPVDGSIFEGVARAASPQRELERIQRHKATMQLLGARFEAFYHFSSRLLGPARGWHAERPWRADIVELNGLYVGLLQLSSAWASGSKEDRGKLMIGEGVVRDGLRDIEPAQLKLALMHHPLSWLHEWDQQRLQELLGSAEGVDFLLRGHLHQSHALALQAPGGRLVELAAGASYTTDNWAESIALTEVDLAQGEARSYLFKYSRRGAGFWAKETDAYEQAPDGVVRMALPPHLHSGTEREVEQADAVETSTSQQAARLESLLERYRRSYRQVAVAVHGQVRFSGVAYDSRKPNARVEELFVPLRLMPVQHDLRPGTPGPWELADDDAAETAGDSAVSTGRLAQWLIRVAAGRGEKAAHAMVLGAPGSGKSTLCVYLTVLLAGGVVPKRGGGKLSVAYNRNCVPLLVPYRELMGLNRERRERGEGPLDLLGFLHHQVNVRLSLPAKRELIEQTLQYGHAVLLVDGLDEVGNAKLRERARDDLVAFCMRFPKTAVLCTSRSAGYGDAPLPRTGPLPFLSFELQPFDEDDLRSFVGRWYELQEPDDVVARDRSAARLIAAIDAAPYVKALAHNPLLATLIALVHHSRAQLPGRRVELYEACVSTLLETWPARRGRRFVAIDEGRQRDYLEQLAISLQRQRGDIAKYGGHGLGYEDLRATLINRDSLVDSLATVLQQRDYDKFSSAQTRRLVHSWVSYIAAETGLLVEQEPGFFGFFHLSFLEYLAACALERSYGQGEPLAEQLLELHQQPRWEQVCLLAAGRNATHSAFIDYVFHNVVGTQRRDSKSWLFLLRCMQEECNFTQRQRDALLSQLGHLLLESGAPAQGVLLFFHMFPWRTVSGEVERVIQFSERHGMKVQSWLEKRWLTSLGTELREAVALGEAFSDTVVSALSRRTDADSAAADLLELNWHAHPVGRWASSHVSAHAALRRVVEGLPFDTTHFLAISASDAAPMFTSSAFTIALVLRVAWAAELERSTRSPQYYRPTYAPVPRVTASPPARKAIRHAPPVSFGFARLSASSQVAAIYKSLHHRQLSNLAYKLPEILAKAALDSSRQTIEQAVEPLIRSVITMPSDSRSWPIKRISNAARRLAEVVASNCDNKVPYIDEHHLEAPVSTLAIRHSWPTRESGLSVDDVEGFSEEELLGYIQPFKMLIDEAALGSVAKTWSFAERYAHINFRVTNRWLFYIWPMLDECMRQDSPYSLALYLALGWTQACSTWQWPATARWVELLGGPPPEHWLPQLHWHQCWRLCEPDNMAHHIGIQKALEEGRRDTELPGYADTLADILLSMEDERAETPKLVT